MIGKYVSIILSILIINTLVCSFDITICDLSNVSCLYLSPTGSNEPGNPCTNHHPYPSQRRLIETDKILSHSRQLHANTLAPTPEGISTTPAPSSPTRHPTINPTGEPTEPPTDEPTDEPTWEPTNQPTMPPTFSVCGDINFVLNLTHDGDIIVFEEGTYNLSDQINIIGLNDIIFTGFNDYQTSGSILTFDFDSYSMNDSTAYINIMNCQNITFEGLIFSGEHYKQNNFNAVFNIKNSSNIVFESVVFQQFNITNTITKASPDMLDMFALITMNNVYDSYPEYKTLSNNIIPSNYSVPNIASTDCSYIIGDMGGSLAMVPRIEYCNVIRDLSDEEISVYSWNYQCIDDGNGSYVINRTLFIGSDDCQKHNKNVTAVSEIIVEDIDNGIFFYCNDETDDIEDICVMKLDAYNTSYIPQEMINELYVVPNDCISSSAYSEDNYESVGFQCVDDSTFIEVLYQDTQCVTPRTNDSFIGYIHQNDECYEDIHVCIEFDCPVTNNNAFGSNSILFNDTKFMDNYINNGFIVKSINTASGSQIELSFINTTATNNNIGDNGGLIYGSNIRLNIDNSSFNNNNMEILDIDGSFPFISCVICLVFDSTSIIYDDINDNGDKYLSNIRNSEFHDHNNPSLKGGIFSIQSYIDVDSIILFDNNVFENNIAGISRGILYFSSYSDGIYFKDTIYCQNNLCGLKLLMKHSDFNYNTGAALSIDIKHNFTASSTHIFAGSFEDEVSITNCKFIHNELSALLPSNSSDIGVVTFNYDYMGQRINNIQDNNYFLSTWNMLNIKNSMFSRNNLRDYNAGALRVNFKQNPRDLSAKYINIINSTFSENVAGNGSAMIFGDINYIFLSMQQCNIYNNTANDYYGAVSIFAKDGAFVDISDCNFYNNTAKGNGGGLFINIKSIASNNRTITSNPTSFPTIEPTREPTTKPTNQPTNLPTHQPTHEPIFTSTQKPTTKPTSAARRRNLLQSQSNVSMVYNCSDDNNTVHCYYANLYPSVGNMRYETVSITNIDENSDVYYDVYFTPQHAACVNPAIWFAFELIDYDADSEYLDVFDTNDNRITRCEGGAQSECGNWTTCLSNYSLGIDHIVANQSYRIRIFEPSTVGALCNAIHLYTINAQLALTCSGNTLKPTYQPTYKPTRTPSVPATTSIPTTPSPIYTKSIQKCPNVFVSDSNFVNNVAYNYGGGIYVEHYDDIQCMNMEFKNVVFAENMAMNGGGFYSNRLDPYYNDKTLNDNDTNILFNNCNFTKNVAYLNGGSMYIVGHESSCKHITANSVGITNTSIKMNRASNYGGGLYAECTSLYINNATISENDINSTESDKVTYSDYDPDTFMDAFGGCGGGIYALSSLVVVTDSYFRNNTINSGNGGALFYTMDTDSNIIQNQDIKLIVSNNIISNNIVNYNKSFESYLKCENYLGLTGFSGGLWIQISEQYNENSLIINENIFEGNYGTFINDIYYNIYNVESLKSLEMLSSINTTNTFNTNSSISVGSSPVSLTNISINPARDRSDGDDACLASEGCIGYVLPGDNIFTATFQLIDIWGDQITPILSCSNLKYTISRELDLEQIFVHLHDNDISLQLSVSSAEYNSKQYINISDTHLIINYNNDTQSSLIMHYVIAILCKAGQSVLISDENQNICSLNDMSSGIAFKCGAECGEANYLFNRWEPECHKCPPTGAICNGGNDVIIDYANWAKVSNETATTGGSAANQVCELTFNTYLCPAELCCTSISGCSFNGYNGDKFCAANRDYRHNFCGKCLEGYYEVVGTYSCSECNGDDTWMLILPILGGICLLIYLLLRDPYTVTPLFTYVYKSLLYFYQIIPILTYQSYLGVISNLSDFFNLSFLYNIFNSNQTGTCLFSGMTAMGKLWSNFLIPLIFVAELLILRFIPEIVQLIVGKDNNKGKTVWKHKDSVDSISESLLNDHSVVTTIDPSGNIQSRSLKREIVKQTSLNWTQKIRENFMQAFWNALLIIYIVICQSAIKMFNCTYVDDAYYLWYAGDYKCYDVTQIIFIIIFVILLLFPGYIIYVLYKLKKTPKTRRLKYAAFTMSYRAKCWYYEAVMMIRRIVLISVYAFPKTQQLLLRGLISFFCTVILMIHVKYQPFLYPINNNLETFLLLLLCLISTLSTIQSSNGDNNKYIRYTITIASAIPILFVFPLAYKYCRRKIVPKMQSFSHNRSRLNSDNTIDDDNLIQINKYVAPQFDPDKDIGNTNNVVDDDLL